jgi:hypothetical protein
MLLPGFIGGDDMSAFAVGAIFLDRKLGHYGYYVFVFG